MRDKQEKAAEALRLVEEARLVAPFSPSPTAYAKFVEPAELYRSAGLHLDAGLAMSSAVDAAFGDPKKMRLT